jgi:hypothetical protein
MKAALQANKANYGMTINNCCFFCGGIEVRDCKGVSITNSIVSCNVEFAGSAANMFSNNYMIVQAGEKYVFAPSTIVRENYTEKGPWELNQ